MISIIILIILLLSQLFVVYRINNRDYMTASFFMISTFIVSAIISLINLNSWEMKINILTTFVLVSMILAFVIGNLLGSNKNNKLVKVKNLTNKSKNIDYIEISTWKVILVLLLMSISTVFYFRFIFSTSLLAGNRYGYSKMFQYARYAINDAQYNVSMNTLLAHSILISECISYIFLFVIIFNVLHKKKNKVIYYFPCILYVIHIGLSTARLDFISYVSAAIIFCVIISIHIDRKNKKLCFKTILYLFFCLFIVFLGFRLLGYLTGKSSVRELWGDIAIYSGSSIPAFDYYLNNRPPQNKIFGKETLYNIYKMAKSVGLTNISYNIALPFINNGVKFETNIYTAFRRLIQDYGFIGAYIIMFFEGIFYGIWTTRVKTKNFIGVSTIIYAFMFYPVIYTFIEEKFIINFTAIKIIYCIIYFNILYKMFIGKRILDHNKIGTV